MENGKWLHRYWLKQLWYEQEASYYRMMQEQQMRQNGVQNQAVVDAFFRPWEHPPTQQGNVAVVRPFHSNQHILSRRLMSSPPKESILHKKLLRGNDVQHQYQQNRYQYPQLRQSHVIGDYHVARNNVVNHSSESVILSRPLILETTTNNESQKNTTHSSSNHYLKYQDNLESENSNDLIIDDDNNEQCDGSDDDDDDVDEIDCESISSESSSSSQPLDLRTTKIPYSSTAEYEISVIRSFSPVFSKAATKPPKESKERKTKKLKTKRRICTACNRTYLKTKNLRWHFKSKLHLKRVMKLGIDDPANQPDTWYRIVEQEHDICRKNLLLGNIVTQDESNV